MEHTGVYIRKKNYRKIVFISLLIFCSIFIFYYIYYQHFRETIYQESSTYLEDISKGISENINRKIDDYYTFLHTLSIFLTTQNVESIHDTRTLIKKQEDYLHYQDILFIDASGLGHRINGQAIPLSDDIYIQKTILNDRQSLSTLQTIDQKKTVLLSVPVHNLILDGRDIVALAVSFEEEAFERILSLTSFNERAASYLINQEGKLIIGPTSHNTMSIGYDSFETFLKSQKDEINELISEKEETGQINFIVDGKYFSMTYNYTKYGNIYLLTFLSGTVAYEKSNLLLKTTLLIFGGVLCVSLALAFILVLFYHRHKCKLENIAYVDPVTGGNTLQAFYKFVKEMTPLFNQNQYALIYTNVKNFKMLNEQLGYSNCNRILQAINESISADLKDREVAGRVTSDHFCVLLEYKNNEDLYDRFANWYALAKQKIENQERTHWTQPEIEFGVYVIKDHSVSLPQMLDRAKLALRDTEAIPNTRFRFALYEDQLRHKLLREQQIEVLMEDALHNGEFQVYLQPKFSATNERLIGAEALTRWISKTEGKICPNEYIPIFEKNGFIIQLDLWVFEEVCRLLRTWLDKGIEPIKVSVNCSRILFKKSDFVMDYVKIAQSYNIPASLIEIELTENIVFENMNRFIDVIKEIQKAGFGCSVDDFGSGYSSLSLIKDISVDTLKLDKVFFRYSEQEQERAKFVISSIISMAKSLSMKTVAEGVEDWEQVEMLKRLGCDYIQGYVFAKPMPVMEFEKFFEKSQNSI